MRERPRLQRAPLCESRHAPRPLIQHHPRAAQAKWFVGYLRDVSVASVIYTGMTNLTSRVFDDDGVDALERVVDAAVTPERVAKVLKVSGGVRVCL